MTKLLVGLAATFLLSVAVPTVARAEGPPPPKDEDVAKEEAKKKETSKEKKDREMTESFNSIYDTYHKNDKKEKKE